MTTSRALSATKHRVIDPEGPIRGPRARRAWRRSLLPVLGVLCIPLLVLSGTSASLRAQEPIRIAALDNERRLEYQAAADAYESALAARAAAEVRFARITQEIDDARAAGNVERRNDALARAQVLTNELLALDARVAETNASLEEAREGYLEILDIQLDFLAGQIEFASTVADSTQLGAMYRDLRNRFDEVESDERGAVTLVAMVIPEITASPRDGPRELRAKADLLERRAQQADSLIAYIDTELVDLERRSQRDRGMRELQRGVQRFDDTRVPVQPARPTDDTEDVASETPEQRAESLRRLRNFYVERKEEALRRAAEFRETAGPIPGGSS